MYNIIPSNSVKTLQQWCEPCRPRLHFDKQKAHVTPSAPPPVPQINLEEQEVLKWRIESLCSLKLLRAVSSVAFSRYKVQALWPITVRMKTEWIYITLFYLKENTLPCQLAFVKARCVGSFSMEQLWSYYVCAWDKKWMRDPIQDTHSDMHLMLLSNMRLNWFIDLFLCFVEFQDAVSENSELHRPVLPHGSKP